MLKHPAQFIVLFLILLTLFVYPPPYQDSFLGDDYVQLNHISEFLERPSSAWRVLNPFWRAWYYRPAQNLWFLSNRLVFGLKPFAYYYLQICLHALAVALVYRVARQLHLKPFTAAVSAALFAFHGHHFDVVTWLSSIAIVAAAVFSLLALSTFLTYLATPQKTAWLVATMGVALATLFVHEQGFLLPIFLFLLWWTAPLWQVDASTTAGPTAWRQSLASFVARQRARLRVLSQRRRETAVFLVLFLAMLLYLVVQLIRPNATLSAGDISLAQWLQYLHPTPFVQYLAQTIARYTLLLGSAGGIITANAYVFAFAALVILAFWFSKGNIVTRWGLAWMALHLVFIYWALWVQKPEFFAGRHIYIAWLGGALALGATLQQYWPRLTFGRRQRKQGVAAIVLTAVLLFHISTILRLQNLWLDLAQEGHRVEQQMKQIMPRVTANTHVFATRFYTKPSYIPATVEVWYQQLLSRPGGSIGQLKAHGGATDSFYLFDYEDGTLYNLMPELQEHDRTIFVWSQPFTAEINQEGSEEPEENAAASYKNMAIAGPPGHRRLGISVKPPAGDDWLSLVYDLTVPAQSELKFAIRSAPDSQSGLTFRVRVSQAGGKTATLFEEMLPPGPEQSGEEWVGVTIPMEAYWKQKLSLRLETSANAPAAEGYWANPRFVIDLP